MHFGSESIGLASQSSLLETLPPPEHGHPLPQPQHGHARHPRPPPPQPRSRRLPLGLAEHLQPIVYTTRRRRRDPVSGSESGISGDILRDAGHRGRARLKRAADPTELSQCRSLHTEHSSTSTSVRTHPLLLQRLHRHHPLQSHLHLPTSRNQRSLCWRYSHTLGHQRPQSQYSHSPRISQQQYSGYQLHQYHLPIQLRKSEAIPPLYHWMSSSTSRRYNMHSYIPLLTSTSTLNIIFIIIYIYIYYIRV